MNMKKQNQLFTCTFCKKDFTSRNALFRHLRQSTTASSMMAEGGLDVVDDDDDNNMDDVIRCRRIQIEAAATAADTGTVSTTESLPIGNDDSLPSILSPKSVNKSSHKKSQRLQHVAVQFGYHYCSTNNEQLLGDLCGRASPTKAPATTTTTAAAATNHTKDGVIMTNTYQIAELIRIVFFQAIESIMEAGKVNYPSDIQECKLSLSSSSPILKSTSTRSMVGYPNGERVGVQHDDDGIYNPDSSSSCSSSSSCIAHLDVLGIHYRGGPSPKDIERYLSSASPRGVGNKNEERNNIQLLVQKMQDIIDTIIGAGKDPIHGDGRDWRKDYIRVISIEMKLPPKVAAQFDAYWSCTQRTYHYLLPIRWLWDSEDDIELRYQTRNEILDWVRPRIQRKPSHQFKERGLEEGDVAVDSEETATVRHTPQCIVNLKEALKGAEGKVILISRTATIPPSSFHPPPSPSSSRFGILGRNPVLPWHNYCDSTIGAGSTWATTPYSSCEIMFSSQGSKKTIWKSVDRVRLGEIFLESDSCDNLNEEESVIVIELKGDDFLPGQVSRLVASAFAISKGWLPNTFFEISTRTEVVIETPSAPPGRLYFASARFHSVEQSKGSSMFSQTGSTESREWLCLLRSWLLSARKSRESEELEWLNQLKLSTCPNICEQLDLVGPPAVMSPENSENETQSTVVETSQESGKEERSLTMLKADVPHYSNVTPSAVPPPAIYRRTLSLLRQICSDGKWPATTGTRSRFLRAPQEGGSPKTSGRTYRRRDKVSKYQGHLYQNGSFLIANPIFLDKDSKPPRCNEDFPDLVRAIFELEELLISSIEVFPTATGIQGAKNNHCRRREPSLCCFVDRNVVFTPHLDNGKPKNDQSLSLTVGLGDYSNGSLIVDRRFYDIRYKPLEYNGWKQVHENEPFHGESFSLVWFSPERRGACRGTEGRPNYDDSDAEALVDAHSAAFPTYPTLKFRRHSTDALVIREILGIDRSCTYEMSSTMWCSIADDSTTARNTTTTTCDGFSLCGHTCVLDIGAHIGVFARYALSVGCKKVIAYEPEPHNLTFLRQNLKRLDETNTEHLEDDATVYIHDCAVAQGEIGTRNLVHAPNRNDGSMNTWRHSLEAYSIYAEDTDQLGPLTRSLVRTVPFFGESGALQRGVTFVKMDCEGAEVDILSSPDCAIPENWLDVTHLAFEWSFTKERRVYSFHKAIGNLERAGFTVVYEGRGSWWDADPTCVWPYFNDILVFAKR